MNCNDIKQQINKAKKGDDSTRNGPANDSEEIDLLNYCKNPINGADCFFSEDTFCKVMGPEPSFEEKILSQLARIKADGSEKQQRNKRKDLDKPKEDKVKLVKAVKEIVYKDLDQQEDVQPASSSSGMINSSVKTSKRKIDVLEYDSDIFEPVSTQMKSVPTSPAECSSPSTNDCHLKSFKPKNSQSISHAEITENHVLIEKDLMVDSDILDPVSTQSNNVVTSPAASSSSSAYDLCLDASKTSPVIPPTEISEDFANVESDSVVELPTIESAIDTEEAKTSVADSNQNTSNTSLLSDEELCLVMPSISSDEEESENEEKLVPYPHNKETAHTEATSASETVPVESDVSAENKTTNLFVKISKDIQDTSNRCHFNISKDIQDISDRCDVQYPCNSSNTVSFDSYATPWQNVMHNATNMESQAYTVNQHEGQMASYLNLPFSDSSYLVPSSQTSSFSDNDIPIFSVKEDSPKSVAQPTGSSHVVKHQRKNAVWSLDSNSEDLEKKDGDALSTKNAAATKDAVKKALKFKQSDLTKAEHEKYLKLFNKYVRPYMSGGQPPIFTEQQLNELTVFEKLQRRVLDEQTEFQSYLQENARRNPQTYSFIKTAARQYASSKARNYHLIKRNIARNSSSSKLQVPLSVNPGSEELTFVQTLLEVGVPPKISLPDIQSGNKPVLIPHSIKKMDSLFPRQSQRKIPGSVHHEPVSLDPNVKTLAMKYNTQVVMSSSVVKCLMDNHRPSYDRSWNIPVTVMEHRAQGKPLKVVYLDKPIFEDNLLIRDYNHLFHKYALRTFVSHPKQRHSHSTKKPVVASLSKHDEEVSALDDPFDMFSTSVDNLETFGTGLSKSGIPNVQYELFDSKDSSEKRIEKSPSKKLKNRKWKDLDLAGEEKDTKSDSSIFESKLRSRKKMVLSPTEMSKDSAKDISEKPDMPTLIGENYKGSAQDCEKSKEGFVPRRVTRSRALEEKSITESSQAETEAYKKSVTPDGECGVSTDSNLGTGTEKDENDARVVANESLISNAKSQGGNAKPVMVTRRSKRYLNQALETDLCQKARKYVTKRVTAEDTDRKRTRSMISDTCGDKAAANNESSLVEMEVKDDSGAQNQGNLKQVAELTGANSQNCDIETSNRSDPGKGLSAERLGEPVKISSPPLSPETNTPLSPIASPPASPTKEDADSQTHSFIQEIPSSPVNEGLLHASMSPVPIIPSSPQISLAKLGSRGPFTSNIGDTNTSQKQLDRAGDKFFSPLDSILGPSFGQELKEEKSACQQEDPYQYLPPTEKCSSLVYNLWIVGTTRVLIRCRCHGILRDNHKSKCVYLSPKMEYQTFHGLEQVTVSEVARNWTACYIRPNTNLLRARINAFTSEIMMFEELQPYQILQSSLNFKPQASFAFLSNVLEQLMSLECGKYLLSHESGTSFCGVRAQQQELSSEYLEPQLTPPKKRKTEDIIPWIPIDPTLLLPHHTAHNRIPATFLPKDFVVTNPDGGKSKKGKGNSQNDKSKKGHNSANQNIKKSKTQGYQKKQKGKKKRSI